MKVSGFRRAFGTTLIMAALSFSFAGAQLIHSDETMNAMVVANRYFMEKWPDVGKTIIAER
ncbi:MAG: hypothetical protein MUE32_08925, partial [Bacteroidales bacterium]|nr:hypothetical protein [Bacteroidales bacterium]